MALWVAGSSIISEQLLRVKGRSVNNADGVAPGWGGGLGSWCVCVDAREQVLDRPENVTVSRSNHPFSRR